MVERARLEIVLRGNTYGGSNPSLCAISRREAFASRRDIFMQRMRNSRGGKQALPAQVGGFYRRQNSGHPLFSVRVRSRRESLSLRHRWAPLGVPFCVVQRELEKRRGSGFGASQALPWGSRLRDTAAYRAAPNEYNPNLKPILVGRAFGLFLFYNLIQMTPLLYYAIIAI